MVRECRKCSEGVWIGSPIHHKCRNMRPEPGVAHHREVNDSQADENYSPSNQVFWPSLFVCIIHCFLLLLSAYFQYPGEYLQ